MAVKQRRSMVAASAPRHREQADTVEELEAAVLAEREKPAPKPPKTKVTISIDQALADELRAANDQLGRKAFPSISAIFEKGGYAELERLRTGHNDGKPFGGD